MLPLYSKCPDFGPKRPASVKCTAGTHIPIIVTLMVLEICYPIKLLKYYIFKIKVSGIPHCRSADHDIASTAMACIVILRSTRRPSPTASAKRPAATALQWLCKHRRKNRAPPTRPQGARTSLGWTLAGPGECTPAVGWPAGAFWADSASHLGPGGWSSRSAEFGAHGTFNTTYIILTSIYFSH